jgi:hypothetical protein
VKSTYEVGLSKHERVSFKFDLNVEESLVGLSKESGRSDDVGTQIVLAGIRPDQNAGITFISVERKGRVI